VNGDFEIFKGIGWLENVASSRRNWPRTQSARLYLRKCPRIQPTMLPKSRNRVPLGTRISGFRAIRATPKMWQMQVSFAREVGPTLAWSHLVRVEIRPGMASGTPEHFALRVDTILCNFVPQ